MARLNDPPQPVGETLEGLKRRFVRQNRELARVNSTQSMRIRTLEGEVSRLLAENVALREQVIKWHQEMENMPGASAWDKVEGLKTRLESQLIEFGGLLQQLGAVHQIERGQSMLKRNSSNQGSPRKSPTIRPWRNHGALVDVNWEAEGRLPPILEGKLFPRRTLGAEAIQDMVADQADMDSPDPGPPPTVHFDESDPGHSEPESIKLHEGPSSEPLPVVSTNFEARKKRRESLHQVTSTIESIGNFEDTRPLDAPRGRPSKTAGKRKMTAGNGDEDRMAFAQTEVIRTDRKRKERDGSDSKLSSTKYPLSALASADKSALGTKAPPMEVKAARSIADNREQPTATGRKALAPKSTNTDPQSPIKLAGTATKNRKVDGKTTTDRVAPHPGKVKDRAKMASGKMSGVEGVSKKEAVNTTAPKTPIPDDLNLFSPTISDPSEPRPERGDTPPPPDLEPGSVTGSFGRSSRRSRGSVSYAEPSLRDKMRRPTKELIDAVSAIDKARLANAQIQIEGSSLDADPDHPRVKQEETDEQQPKWATKPVHESRSQQERQQSETNSPLGNKVQMMANTLPASVVTDRRRRASSITRNEDLDHGNSDLGSAAVIAALSHTTDSKARNQSASSADHGGIHMAGSELLERTSIFDFTSSSPEHVEKMVRSETMAKPTRASRRHSSVPTSGDPSKKLAAATQRQPAEQAKRDDNGAKTESRSCRTIVGQDTTDKGSLGRAASRRRSMMI